MKTIFGRRGASMGAAAAARNSRRETGTCTPRLTEERGTQNPDFRRSAGFWFLRIKIQSPSGRVIFKGVRYFFTRRHPQTARILLVESGPRYVVEGILSGLRG